MKRRKHQKFRSRGGIRLPAAITLCLALSLLIFPGQAVSRSHKRH
nr:hypothetical protein [Butyricicoccus sp. AF10-3]